MGQLQAVIHRVMPVCRAGPGLPSCYLPVIYCQDGRDGTAQCSLPPRAAPPRPAWPPHTHHPPSTHKCAPTKVLPGTALRGTSRLSLVSAETWTTKHAPAQYSCNGFSSALGAGVRVGGREGRAGRHCKKYCTIVLKILL